MGNKRVSAKTCASLLAISLILPSPLWACACGCGVFEVGTSALLPEGRGSTLFTQFSYLDQTENWSGTSQAPAQDNEDRHIRTEFATLGLQTMFDRRWGLRVELPYDQRHFATLDDDTGELARFDHGQVGDIRISGIYDGFSADMSSGIQFGVKLPNGNWRVPGFDRDTQLGTGSTDILVGGYHQTHLGGAQSQWTGFAHALLDVPVATRGGYRPGSEFNAAVGAYPDSWRVAGFLVTPTLQALVAYRSADGGPDSDPDNTGYRRLMAMPGLELRRGDWRVAADFAAPLYQNVRGNQLVAPWQFSLTLSIKL